MSTYPLWLQFATPEEPGMALEFMGDEDLLETEQPPFLQTGSPRPPFLWTGPLSLSLSALYERIRLHGRQP